MLPWWLISKKSACSAGDSGDTVSLLESGRSHGERNGSSLQYSCLGNPMDKGALTGYNTWDYKRVGHDSLQACIHMHIYIYMCVYTHTYVYVYIYIYTHTHTHIYPMQNSCEVVRGHKYNRNSSYL